MSRTPQEIVEEAQRRVTAYWQPWKTRTSSAQTVRAKEAIDALDPTAPNALQKLRGIVAAYVEYTWQFKDDIGRSTVNKGDFWGVLKRGDERAGSFLSEIFSLEADVCIFPTRGTTAFADCSMKAYFGDIERLNSLLETCLFDESRLRDLVDFLACIFDPTELVRFLYDSAFFEIWMQCTGKICCGFTPQDRKNLVLTYTNNFSVQDVIDANAHYGGSVVGIRFHQDLLENIGIPTTFARAFFDAISDYIFGFSSKQSTVICSQALEDIASSRKSVDEQLKAAAVRVYEYIVTLFVDEQTMGPFFELLQPFLSELFRYVSELGDRRCKDSLTAEKINAMLPACVANTNKLNILCQHVIDVYGGHREKDKIVAVLKESDFENYLNGIRFSSVEDYWNNKFNVSFEAEVGFSVIENLTMSFDIFYALRIALQPADGASTSTSTASSSADEGGRVVINAFCKSLCESNAEVESVSIVLVSDQLFILPFDVRDKKVFPKQRCALWLCKQGTDTVSCMSFEEKVVGFVGHEDALVYSAEMGEFSIGKDSSSEEGEGLKGTTDLFVQPPGGANTVAAAMADKLDDASSEASLEP